MCCRVVMIVVILGTTKLSNCCAFGTKTLQLLNQIFRGFFKALPVVEFVGPDAAGMAVDDDGDTAFFPGAAGEFGLQLAADAVAAGVLVDGEGLNERNSAF